MVLRETVQEQATRLAIVENELIETRAARLPSPMVGSVLPEQLTILSGKGRQLYATVIGQIESSKGKSSMTDFWYTVNMKGLVPDKPQQVISLMAKNKVATPEFLEDPANAFAVNLECVAFIELNGNGGSFNAFRNRRSAQICDLIEGVRSERLRVSNLPRSSSYVAMAVTVKPINEWTLEFMWTDPILQYVSSAVRLLVTEASAGAPTVLSVYGFACVAHIMFEEQHLAVSFTLCSPLRPIPCVPSLANHYPYYRTTPPLLLR